MTNQIRIGSQVIFQNLNCKVIGRDGKAWIVQPVGSRSESFRANENQLTIRMSEGHLDAIRMEEFRNNLLND